jgi:hypothetical protein
MNPILEDFETDRRVKRLAEAQATTWVDRDCAWLERWERAHGISKPSSSDIGRLWRLRRETVSPVNRIATSCW